MKPHALSLILLLLCLPLLRAQETDVPSFSVPEEAPAFPGGHEACQRFIYSNLNYRLFDSIPDGVEGRVTVGFRIDTLGQIRHPAILRGVHPLLDKEALRIVSLMPRWTPYRLRGVARECPYALPVVFRRSDIPESVRKQPLSFIEEMNTQTNNIKKMNTQTNDLKEIIKRWIIHMDEMEELPSDIVALSFNLYEPYGLEMIGSSWFDEEDEDWACDEDFEPAQRSCPGFEMSEDLNWEEVLEIVASILKDLIKELPDINLFKVEHIAVGFVDGNLTIVK